MERVEGGQKDTQGPGGRKRQAKGVLQPVELPYVPAAEPDWEAVVAEGCTCLHCIMQAGVLLLLQFFLVWLQCSCQNTKMCSLALQWQGVGILAALWQVCIAHWPNSLGTCPENGRLRFKVPSPTTHTRREFEPVSPVSQ